MSSPLQNRFSSPSDRKKSMFPSGQASGLTAGFASCDAEDTLRLIAKLPVPEGLVSRVQSKLHTSPRAASVLDWPGAFGLAGSWMHGALLRGAAAATIVFVVAGGGWGIFSRVQLAAPPAAKVIATPRPIGSTSGFSSAGAIRKPETLNGPVLTHSAKPTPQQTDVSTPAARPVQKPLRGSHSGKAKKVAPPAVGLPMQ